MRRVLMAAAMSGGLATSPAWADLSKGQELMILALHSAALAADHCAYRLDERQVQALLSRKGLKRSDLDAAARHSPLLREDLAADDQRYESDTAAACDQAWASFGPGGPLQGLLRAK